MAKKSRKLYRQWTKQDVNHWRTIKGQYDSVSRRHLFIGHEKRCACCYLRLDAQGLTCVDITTCSGAPAPIVVMMI